MSIVDLRVLLETAISSPLLEGDGGQGHVRCYNASVSRFKLLAC